MKHFFAKILLLFGFMVLVQCSQTISSGIQDKSANPNLVELSDEDTGVGTIVESLIRFKGNSTSNEIQFCKFKNSKNLYECPLTSEEISVSLKRVSLISCKKNQTNQSCHMRSPENVLSRTDLYVKKGEGQKILLNQDELTSQKPVFDSDQSIGGVLLVIDSYEFTLSEDSIADTLKQVRFKVCLANHKVLDSLTMEDLCGQASAYQGDLLIDANGDGLFGFWDTKKIADGIAQEIVGDRPENYQSYFPDIKPNKFYEYSDVVNDVIQLNKGEFYIIAEANEGLLVEKNKTYSIDISFDFTNLYFKTSDIISDSASPPLYNSLIHGGFGFYPPKASIENNSL